MWNFKKFTSGFAAMAVAATAFVAVPISAGAAEGDVIYTNDFSAENLNSVTTWTSSPNKPTGYSRAQIGRNAKTELASEKLTFTSDGGKANSTVAHAAFGYFDDTLITNPTAEKAYTLSFDLTAYTNHTAGDQNIFELINTNKNVIFGMYLNHTRANSATGANTVYYYVGGKNGFKVAEDSNTKSVNAEGFKGDGIKELLYSDDFTSTTVSFSVSLTVDSSTGIGELTIKDASDTKLVNSKTVTIDAESGLDAIYASVKSYNNSSISTITIDNFSIVEAQLDTSNVASYKVSYKDQDGNTIKPSDTRNGNVGTTIALSANDIDTFYNSNRTIKYKYFQDDAKSTTITADGLAEATVTFKAYNRMSHNVNAYATIEGVNTIIKSDSVSGYFDEEDYTYGPYAYILYNGNYYKYNNVNAENGSVPAVTVSNANTDEIILNYSLADAVVYYAEAETASRTSGHSNGYSGSSSIASGGYQAGAVYGETGAGNKITGINIPVTGTYKVSANSVGTPSAERSCWLAFDDTTIHLATLTSGGDPALVYNENVHLAAGTHDFYWVGNGSNSCLIDYMVLELVSIDPPTPQDPIAKFIKQNDSISDPAGMTAELGLVGGIYGSTIATAFTASTIVKDAASHLAWNITVPEGSYIKSNSMPDNSKVTGLTFTQDSGITDFYKSSGASFTLNVAHAMPQIGNGTEISFGLIIDSLYAPNATFTTNYLASAPTTGYDLLTFTPEAGQNVEVGSGGVTKLSSTDDETTAFGELMSIDNILTMMYDDEELAEITGDIASEDNADTTGIDDEIDMTDYNDNGEAVGE